MVFKDLKEGTEVLYFDIYQPFFEKATILKEQKETAYLMKCNDYDKNYVTNKAFVLPLEYIKKEKIDWFELKIVQEICNQIDYATDECGNLKFKLLIDCVQQETSGFITISSTENEIKAIKKMCKEIAKAFVFFRENLLYYIEPIINQDVYNQFVSDFDKFIEESQYLD